MKRNPSERKPALPERRNAGKPKPVRRPPPVLLPADSLAFSLHAAALCVAAVLEGENFTEAYARVQREAQVAWTDRARGAIRDLAAETLRDYGRGEFALQGLLRKPLPLELHALMLVAISRLSRFPDASYTIVDQAVEAAGVFASGLRGVINGVLRTVLRNRDRLAFAEASDPVVRHAHPDWWVQLLQQHYPEAWQRVLEMGNQKPPMTLRINRRHGSVAEYHARLREAGIAFTPLDNEAVLLEKPLAVSQLPDFAAGAVSVQDAGAQRAARLLDLRPGMRVLDACAAPGGKAAHILELQDVQLTALELDPRRAEKIVENFTRLQLQGEVKVGDASEVRSWWDGEAFDRILADVPCSASGVVRRHPDIKWLRRYDDIGGFVTQQRKILAALWQTLAPGGKLLYATCSVFEQENRKQIQDFCRTHADARWLPINDEPDCQLLPASNQDGFYYALLEKAGSEQAK